MRIRFTCLSAAVLLLAGCSRSNNLFLGRVEATVDGHRVVVTDCYRTSVPPPQTIKDPVTGDLTFQFMPCKDADVRIRAGDLFVNGRAYGHLDPSDAVLVDHGVVSTGGPDAERPKTRVELDIPYAHDSPSQTLDLYIPAKNGFATIVYTYGGGWHSGSGKSSKPIAEKLQSLGYGCALVSHRLSPPSTFPAHAEDVASAFAWVKSNIAARGGDPKRVILAGHSSGAHLSLLVAMDPRYLAPHHLSPSDVAAVIALSPPLDLAPRGDGHGYGDVLMAGHGADAFKRDSALMKDASPIDHISAGMPRTLLLVGGQDFSMLEADARAFAEKARAAGATVETAVIPGKDHMAMAGGLTDENDPVLARALDFLKHL